jgi:uncharacterized membrane protein
VKVGGVLVGIGLGGFVDGIVLHQVLQWHHMLTDYGAYDRYPPGTVSDLETNTLWDGVFHSVTWIPTVVGLVLLYRAAQRGGRPGGREMAALLLLGWGSFNLVEGVVDHHLLRIHHVRDDVPDPLWWDVGFLAFGALLVGVGWALRRTAEHPVRAPSARPTSPDRAATPGCFRPGGGAGPGHGQ